MILTSLFIYLFLIIIRPQDFVGSVAGLPLVFFSMLFILVGWSFSSVDKKLVKTAQDQFVLFYYTMFVVSTLTLHWFQYMTTIFIDTGKLLLIYWFIVTTVNSTTLFRKVFWMVMLLISTIALMGVLQFHGYDITGQGMVWDRDAMRIRLTGIFDNPNDIAYTVLMIVPFGLGLFLQNKGKSLLRITGIGMVWLGIYCVLLTGSRGGLLSLVVALMVFLYYWYEKTSYRRVVFVMGVVVVLIAMSIQTRDYRSDESAMGRVEAWAVGWELMKEHPLIGVGKDQFREFNKRDTHSSYVRAASELGLPGLYAFIAILLFTIRNMNHLLKTTPRDEWRFYSIAIIAYLGGFAVASVFSTRTYDPVFMLLIALSSAICRITTRARAAGEADTYIVPLFNSQAFQLLIGILIALKLFMMQAW